MGLLKPNAGQKCALLVWPLPDVAHGSRRAVSPFVATCLVGAPASPVGDGNSCRQECRHGTLKASFPRKKGHRQALDYTSTGRAVGVCLIGWLVNGAILSLGFILLR